MSRADRNGLSFRIAVRQPFPWRALLAYFESRLIDGFETVESSCYVRVGHGYRLQAGYDESLGMLDVMAQGLSQADACARVTHLFSPQHDGDEVAATLVRHPMLASRIARCPGFRPLGCWSPFELCIRTLVGQQVTVAAARTLLKRLIARCGELTPTALASSDLSAIGMPGKRVAAIRHFAAAVADGQLHLDAGPWPALDRELAALPGFGPWTRAYLAIRLGRDPDAFPDSDIGLLRAAGVATPRELRQLAQAWRPYRGYAATLLWAVPA